MENGNLREAKLKDFDPEVWEIIENQMHDDETTIDLIASDNFFPKADYKAQGAPMSGRYSEGYPGARFYRGQKNVDELERLAIERAKEVFGAEHANVQPYSGSIANIAALRALAMPGETILGMSLDAGGHLSHGSIVHITGDIYEAEHYGVNSDGWLDYDAIRKMALEVRPRVIICGASAYPRMIDFSKFGKIADEAKAYLVADIAHIAGLVAAGIHPSPIPYCDVVTTTTHKTLRAMRGAMILCKKEDRLRPGSKKTLADRIDSAVFPGIQGGPIVPTIAAIAVGLKQCMTDEYREYERQIVANSKALAAGLMEHSFNLITGGTDNHLMLVDLRDKGVDGDYASAILEEAGIISNKNKIAGDKSAKRPSGIRFGTPAATTRGMKEKEMGTIADWIHHILLHPQNVTLRKDIREEVRQLCLKFPIYVRTY